MFGSRLGSVIVFQRAMTCNNVAFGFILCCAVPQGQKNSKDKCTSEYLKSRVKFPYAEEVRHISSKAKKGISTYDPCMDDGMLVWQ